MEGENNINNFIDKTQSTENDFHDYTYHKHNKRMSLEETLKFKEAIDMYRFQSLFKYLYWLQSEKEWSSLYTIINYEWNKKIIEIAKSNFDREMFNTKWDTKIKWYYHTPIPLFVVERSNAEFANEEQQLDREKNPKKYLDECAIIVAPKWWQAYEREIYGHQKTKKLDYSNINILSYDNAIIEWRNKIIEIKINNEEKEEKFKRFMEDIQKRSIENLKNYIFNIKEYNWLLWKKEELTIFFIEMLRNMWVNTHKENNNDIVAIQSFYNLVHSYDKSKKKFTTISKR